MAPDTDQPQADPDGDGPETSDDHDFDAMIGREDVEGAERWQERPQD